MDPPQRKRSRSQPSTSRQQQPVDPTVSLLRFPPEVLEQIISWLHLEDQCTLSRMNITLRAVVTNCVREARVKEFTDEVLAHFRDKGRMVRLLSISNCRRPPRKFSDIMLNCPNITVFDAVNTTLTFVDMISCLKRLGALQSLSFSLTMVSLWWPLQVRPSPHLRNLYVETYLDPFQLNMLIYLMNQFRSLQTVHVNLIDTTRIANIEILTERYDADLWRSLNTFICSCYLGVKNFQFVPTFLRNIFASKMTRRINEWIGRRKGTYIYEHGYLNDTVFDEGLDDVRVRVLKRYQLADLDRMAGHFAAPWGPPESLRIRGRMESHANVDLTQLFTSELRELDLTACHGEFKEEYLEQLIDSVPRLESLAMPLCGFLVKIAGGDEKKAAQMLLYRANILKKVNLKKFYLKGLEPIYKDHVQRIGFRGNCQGCKEPLSSENLPQLYDLDHLDELTFENVFLSPSAFDNMANPSARTVRITFSDLFDFKLLGGFLARCTQVRNLKLFGFRGRPFKNKDLTSSLEAAVRVKQLCIGDLIPTTYANFDLHDLGFYPPIAEIVHVHNISCEMGTVHLVDIVTLSRSLRRRIEVHTLTSSTKESFPGRGLCHSGSFAGFVRPAKWTNEFK